MKWKILASALVVFIVVITAIPAANTIHTRWIMLRGILHGDMMFGSGTLSANIRSASPGTGMVATAYADTLSPSKQAIVQYIQFKFGQNAQTALCIAEHESGITAAALHYNTNGTIDRGVFQINSIHGYDPGVLYNWRDNVDIAYTLSHSGTWWMPWTTRTVCL